MENKVNDTHFIRAGILSRDNQKVLSFLSMSSVACREGTRTVRFGVADSMDCREAS